MKNGAKILALGLAAVLAAVWLLGPALHHAPVNPKIFILNVGIESASTFQVSMWVPVGSTNDTVPGIAHVLEHLKFKTHEGDGFKGFDAIAGSSSNASTTYRVTRYDLNVPPVGLDKALEVLALMSKTLTIDEADLKLEKSVVQQELFQRTQSDPDTAFYQDFSSALYAGTPYQGKPGGTQESVASVTMKHVLDFDAAYYTDSPRFILIAGPPLRDVEKAALEKRFPNAALATLRVRRDFTVTRDDSEFKNLPAFVRAVDVPAVSDAEVKREKSSARARNVKLTYSKLINAPTSWRGLSAASILRDAIRSRLPEGLQDRIAEDNRLVQDWSVSAYRLMDGVWQLDFSATVENGVKPDDVRSAFESYMQQFASTGLSQQSFDRLKARNFLTNEWENSFDRANELASDTIRFGYDKAITSLDDLQDTKLADVNDLLQLLQKPGRVAVAIVKPEGSVQ